MNSRCYIFTPLFISLFLFAEGPIVFIDLPALLGNRLWGFCVAKIIAYELGFDLYCKPIYGFPNTYCYQPNYPHNGYRWERHGNGYDINIQGIINNKAPRNIMVLGYLQRYRYLEHYTDLIKNDWLKIDPALKHKVDEDDIVAHVRIHAPSDAPAMNFEYYKTALEMAQYKQLYICTNEPKHPYIKNFEPYNPIIVSVRDLDPYSLWASSWDETTKLNIDDFAFIASFNKIIISYSTYSWWAGFLSDAAEVYAPYNEKWPTECGKVNEQRYIYIDTDVR